MLVLDVALGVLALVGLALITLTARRMILQRPIGTFACSLRRGEHAAGDGWSYGIGRYHGDRIEWYRIFAVSPRPKHVLNRRPLVVRARRDATPAEAHSFPGGSLVLECTYGGEPVALAMSPDAMTGFLSWVEAAPPSDPMAA